MSEAFSKMLDNLLSRGTRPDGNADSIGKAWSNSELAKALGSNERTVRNWRSGRSLPIEISTLEGVIFGNNKNFDDWRVEFREVYNRCRRLPGPKAISEFEKNVIDELIEQTVAQRASGKTIGADFIHEMASRVDASSGLDIEGKMQAVRNAIDLYVAEIAGGTTQTNLGDIVDPALAKARSLLDQGKSGLARASLRKTAEGLKRTEEDRRAHYAESIRALYGRERDIALAVFDGHAAAEAVLAMAEALHSNDPAGARGAIESATSDLMTFGDEKGSNVHLVAAIALYQHLVLVAENLQEKARIQNNLGNALRTLGERESGTARLEEAVAAYSAALEERTQARVPLDWATTQNNLGNALSTLGERESGTARLEEAVAAYRAALEERTQARVPLDWAMTQNNLGTALWALGERESGNARLEEAVAAYRGALEEGTQARVPLQWAATQRNFSRCLALFEQRYKK